MLNFRSFYQVTKRHFAVVLFLVISYAGAVVYLWERYGDIQKQQAEVNLSQQRLSEEKIQFERHKSEELEARFQREAELQKRELIASQTEEKNAIAEADIKRREAKYVELVAEVNSEQQKLSESAQRQAAEVKLQSLMSEFSALGVNLNAKPCRDPEAIRKYNSAKAKYDEIYSWAEAHNLNEKYSNFLLHNQQSVIRFCDS